MKLGKLLALSAASLLMITACGKQGGQKDSASSDDTIEIIDGSSEEEKVWDKEVADLLDEYIGCQVPYVEMGVEDCEWDEEYECVSIYGTEFSNSLVLGYTTELEHKGYTVYVYDYYGDGELSVDAAIKVDDTNYVSLSFYNMGDYSELDVYLADYNPVAAPLFIEKLNSEVFDGEAETASYNGVYLLLIDIALDETQTLVTWTQYFDTQFLALTGMVAETPMAWDEEYGEYFAEYIYNDEVEVSLSVSEDEDEETGEKYIEVFVMAY